jgi:uncharacterized membrane protein YsdA (DUF1294 family)
MVTTALILLLAPALLLKDLRNGAYALHLVMAVGVCWLLNGGLGEKSFNAEHIPTIIMVHLVSINIATFLLYGLDKRRAKYGGWRVPEATLHMFGLIGGTIGAMVGQKYFRHKTKKKAFKILFWVFFIIQILVAIYLYALFSI